MVLVSNRACLVRLSRRVPQGLSFSHELTLWKLM